MTDEVRAVECVWPLAAQLGEGPLWSGWEQAVWFVNISKPAFGGSDLRTLYITTAWKTLDDEQRAEQPLAGGLFRTRVAVPGLSPGRVAHGL